MNPSPADIVMQVALRTWRKIIRRPLPLTFSFVQPLFWMLIFGFLFHRFSLGTMFEGRSYLDFLLPGICAMTVLFGASQAGVDLVRDMQTGFIQRMVRSTRSPVWILVGKLGAEVIRLLAQGAVVVLIGFVLGADLSIDPAGLAVGVAGLALFGWAYGSLSCWIALKTGAPESMGAFVHVVNMPLLFTSTALAPRTQMPEWLSGIAAWNPLTLVADALRESMIFGRVPDIAPLVLPVAGLAILLFLPAFRAMRMGADRSRD